MDEGAVHGLGMERLLQSPFAKGFQGQPCELALTKQGWREKHVPLLCTGMWVLPVSQPTHESLG